MRYHWGLGVGHTYSHGRDVHSQKYSTVSSTCEAGGLEEDSEGLPDSSTQAVNISGGEGNNKQNELESNERAVTVQLSLAEPENSMGDIDMENLSERPTQAVPDANESDSEHPVQISERVQVEGTSDSVDGNDGPGVASDSSAGTTSDEWDGSSSDDQDSELDESDNDSERLELYHTYRSE